MAPWWKPISGVGEGYAYMVILVSFDLGAAGVEGLSLTSLLFSQDAADLVAPRWPL